MTNRNSWQLLECSAVCPWLFFAMLLFIATYTCMSVCMYVCMFVCWEGYSKTNDQSLMIFYAIVGHNPEVNQIDFEWQPSVKISRGQKVKIDGFCAITTVCPKLAVLGKISVKVSTTLAKCCDAAIRQNFAEFLPQIQFTNVKKHTKFQIQNLLYSN